MDIDGRWRGAMRCSCGGARGGAWLVARSETSTPEQAALVGAKRSSRLSVDRITLELDKLLEDAPVPLIMQQAAKISSIRKRVLSLNMLLKSIQRRMDRIDQIVSAGSTDNMAAGTSVIGGASGTT